MSWTPHSLWFVHVNTPLQFEPGKYYVLAAAQLLYTINGIRHSASAAPAPAATSAGGPNRQGARGGVGGGGGGVTGSGGVDSLSEASKVLAAHRGRKPLPPPPLARAGVLRLIEAARLALERLGEADETMNLAESAWALMFGCVSGLGGANWSRGEGGGEG